LIQVRELGEVQGLGEFGEVRELGAVPDLRLRPQSPLPLPPITRDQYYTIIAGADVGLSPVAIPAPLTATSPRSDAHELGEIREFGEVRELGEVQEVGGTWGSSGSSGTWGSSGPSTSSMLPPSTSPHHQQPIYHHCENFPFESSPGP
jgi:hypothetical protein